MKISQATLNRIQAEGYQLITVPYDDHYKTDTMIIHPDGTRSFGYPDWYSVPYSTLQNGDAFDVVIDANMGFNQGDNFDMIAIANQTAGLPSEEGLLFWAFVVLFVVLVIAAIASCVVYVVENVNAPCGTEGQVTQVTECEKLIIKPDCSSATFNICADPNGDGIYEGQYTSDWTGGNAWVTWLLLGIVAVGGIYLLAKILPSLFQKKPQYMQYYPQPQQQQQFRRAPGIDYVY